MAERLILLGHRLVGLIVRVILRLGLLGGGAVQFGPAAVLLLEVQRPLAALAHEVRGQVGVPLLAGHLGQAHQRHLRDLVPRVPVQLALLGTEAGGHVVGEAAGRLEQLVLAGALVVGHRALGQMAEAVQLVVVLEVGEVAVHAVEDVVGVEIAVVELGRADDVDRRVGGRLELGVRVVRKAVAHRLDPLREVGVLEHEAVELVGIGMRRVLRLGLEAAVRVGRRHEGLALGLLAGVLRGRRLEVVHAVAGRGARHLVVQRVPLVRDHRRAHELLLGVPERIGDGDAPEIQGRAVLRGHGHLL